MLRNKKKGFTLVELIIVIAIIGILIAIAIPRFADATQGAKNRKIDTAARTIASSMAQYYANHLKWPSSNVAGEKTNVLKASGITDAAEQARWTFRHVPATTGTSATDEKIEVVYTWGTGDKYTGTVAKSKDTTKATFEF